MAEYEFDLGSYSCPVSTDDEAAQRWFDRGLNWTYGFNHDEAVQCYARALEADAHCPMAHWGMGYALGPNYNLPWQKMDAAGQENFLSGAYDATQKALACISRASPVEAALIRALAQRYPQRTPTDLAVMQGWDHAFADAMRAAFAQFPDHLDLRAVYVESLLTLTPWKMWDLPGACPAEGAATVEAQEVLEDAFATQPGAMRHPGLLHLYVHLMEMSPFPEKALQASDVLRNLVPDAGHLIHMPTHIDVLCGNYQDTVFWNERAIEADLKFFTHRGAFKLYTGYRQHNYHFAVYGALFLGQMEPALRAIRGMQVTVPEELLRVESPPMAEYYESYMGLEPHVLIRFGRWEEAKALQPPEDQELYCTGTAYVHYARAVAMAATGDVAGAEAEELVFLAACDRVPETRLMHNNTVRDLLEIAKEMLRGEIAYRKEEYDAAFAHLRRSVALDDALPYDEPWGWMQPARHALGALLFEQGHVAEAEAVYREDLGLGGQLSRAAVNPLNVWSLKGLHDCLEARGDEAERPMIRQQLDIALARADAVVAASCFCAQAAMESCPASCGS